MAGHPEIAADEAGVLPGLLRCRCGAAVEEEGGALRCHACGTLWPRHGNVVDLHPGIPSLEQPAAVVGPLGAFYLVPAAGVPLDAGWVERAAAWVRGGRAGVHVLRGRAALGHGQWRPDEGVGLLCRETGELSAVQKLVAWRARKRLVLKCYPLGAWDRLLPEEILAGAARQVLAPGIALLDLERRRQRRRLVHRTLTDPALGDRFRRRYAREARPGQVVLDLGCGWGRHAGLLATAGCTVLGLDPHAHPDTWGRVPHSLFLRGTAEDLGCLRSHSVDGGLCLEVLSYLEDDRRSLDEVRRVLRPGGWLLVSVTNRENSWTRRTGRRLLASDRARRYYGAEELRDRLAGAGFRIVRAWAEGIVAPVLPRVAATVTDLLLPAAWSRGLERLVPEPRRKLLWMAAVREDR